MTPEEYGDDPQHSRECPGSRQGYDLHARHNDLGFAVAYCLVLNGARLCVECTIVARTGRAS